MNTTLKKCTTLYKDEDVETFRNDEQDQTVVHFLQEDTIHLENADSNSTGSSSDISIEESIIMSHNEYINEN